MARQKHVHKYHKLTTKYRTLWACALPLCSHYMPPDLTENLIGKMSICWKCNEQFLLDDNNMKLDKPLCGNCNPTADVMGSFLKELGMK